MNNQHYLWKCEGCENTTCYMNLYHKNPVEPRMPVCPYGLEGSFVMKGVTI